MDYSILTKTTGDCNQSTTFCYSCRVAVARLPTSDFFLEGESELEELEKITHSLLSQHYEMHSVRLSTCGNLRGGSRIFHRQKILPMG